jgi:YHS domain-containing protein
MNLIEILYPEGRLDPARRKAIAAAVISSLLRAPEAPPSALERAGRMTHVWFRECRDWTTGDGPFVAAVDAGIPLVVTVTVPEVWRAELSARAIGAVRDALADVGMAPEDGEEPALWVNVVGIEEGSIGMAGQPTRSADIVRHLTAEVEVPAEGDLPDGVAIDPVCGMEVGLGTAAVTLEHDGRTVAFCSHGCRDVYAEDHGIDLAAASAR